MAVKIEKKIVAYGIKHPEEDADCNPSAMAKEKVQQAMPQQQPEQPVLPGLEQFDERLERPDVLIGSTYKIRTPLSDYALYVTINDVVLNQGTPHEIRRPFEIFINSKNMDHFQWTVALTRVMSAVFRKGGDISFLIEELHSVFDPKGGYLKKGGKYIPSLVAEIGDVIETHLQTIGMLPDRELDSDQRKYLENKRLEIENMQKDTSIKDKSNESGFPAGAALCGKCHTKAVVRIDNCATCLNCGDSKCG